MPLWILAVLAIIQGLTEFLPISSSAHLILPSQVLGWPDQGVVIDVAVHVGSLFAVMLYFRKDVMRLFIGVGDLARRTLTPDAWLLIHLVLATIPAVVLGAALALTGAVDALRSAEVIGWTSILFGLLLYEADRIGLRFKRMEHMSLKGAMVIGLFQAVALIPGTSRSGITMTAGRFLGYEREDAARFSMLLSIPTIAASGLLATVKALGAEEPVVWTDVGTVIVLSFVCAFAAIWFFIKWVNRIGFTPFVIYRLILGVGLLIYVYAFT